MASLEERVATNEQVLRDLRDDMAERVREEQRTRERLHKVEGATAMILDERRVQGRTEDANLRKLALRVQQLTLVVMVVGVLVPLAVALLASH